MNSDTSLKQSDAHKSLETHLIEKLRSRRLSVEEAANFLDSLGADKSETETILSHLKELQYLDDIQLAEALMHTYYECKKLSTTAVQAQMRKRKIASSVIDTVTDQFTNKNPEGEDNETERVIALAQKRAQQLAFLDKTVIQRRLIGFLLRKGYSFDVVHKALNHIDLSDT